MQKSLFWGVPAVFPFALLQIVGDNGRKIIVVILVPLPVGHIGLEPVKMAPKVFNSRFHVLPDSVEPTSTLPVGDSVLPR